MKIELGKKYISEGCEGRVVCIDANSHYFPVVWVRDWDGSALSFTKTGCFSFSSNVFSNRDLKPVPVVTEVVTYMNTYKNAPGNIYNSAHMAFASANKLRTGYTVIKTTATYTDDVCTDVRSEIVKEGNLS